MDPLPSNHSIFDFRVSSLFSQGVLHESLPLWLVCGMVLDLCSSCFACLSLLCWNRLFVAVIIDAFLGGGLFMAGPATIARGYGAFQCW